MTTWMPKKRIAATAAALLVVAVAAFFLAFDWNWLKKPIENIVSASTGRRLEIQGNLSGQWRLTPRFKAEQVRFANPDWAENPLLLSAEEVQIKIALLPLLLKRQIHAPELVLRQPIVHLERLSDGRATWLFDREQREEGSAPQIDLLHVDQGRLHYRDAVAGTRLVAKIQDQASDTDPRSLKFQVEGAYRNQPVAAQGATASLLALQDRTRRLPLLVKGTLAGTQINLDGEIEGLTRFENIALRYDISGRSLRQLAPVFGVPLLETPPYAVSGVLNRAGNRWETKNLRGKVGNSDVAGTVVVTTGGDKPNLEAKLESALLDLADLGPLIGTQQTASGKPATPRQRVFPERNFDLSRVNQLNAHVTLKAKQLVRAAEFPFDDFFADFRLKDSQIVIDPLEFGMAGGELRSRVTLDARQPVIQSFVNGRMTGVRVAKIFPDQGELGNAAGTLSGFVDLKGRGNSISAMLGTASGRTTLLLSDGRVPSLLPAIADLDGMRVLGSFLGKKPENVRCAAIDLNLKQGMATPNVAVFETDTTVLTADGTIDLNKEQLALKVTQAPKKPSFLSLRTPIEVSGTLKQPRFGVDPAPLAARGAAAVVLAMINPLAAAFALIETGPGQDGACPEIQRGLKAGSATAPAKPAEPATK